MKILITRSSENQTIGGAELSARDQAIVLKKLGHTPIVCTNSRRIQSELSQASIPVYRSFYLQRFAPPLRYVYFWGLFPIKIVYDALLALFLRPDVINPHTREDQISFTLSKWLHRRPVIWKDPGDIVFVLQQNHGFIGNLYKKLYLHTMQKADHIYVLNDEHRDVLLETLGDNMSSRLSWIPSSILYENYSVDDHTDRPVLAFGSICRLSKEKNIETLIHAYKKIVTEIPNSQLLIVGDGPERAALEALAEGTPEITFTGNSENVSEYLNRIDVLVHPASQEGWGRTIKEAMYFGKPIIGADVGGIAKQITDQQTGLLFNPSDVDELARLMLQLSTDKPLQETLSTNARAKALDDGDFTDIVRDKILPLYNQASKH